MKYEFHVGDYVETIVGWVGWITIVREDGWILVTGTDGSSCSYFMPNEQRFFKRIGKYDFTKKDEGKIDKLNLQGYLSVQSVAETVNELIEAVNRLKEKVNGMA